MAIVTTYVCDVSGVSGQDRDDFVDVSIITNRSRSSYSATTINKLIHRDVALKLNLVTPNRGEEKQPDVSFEHQLSTLLTGYIADVVFDEVSNQISNRCN